MALDWHNFQIQFACISVDQMNTAKGTKAQPRRAGRRLYDRLRAQIAGGSLAPGAALPSTRALALEWGISRTTVTAVYEQLAAEGYLDTSARTRARVAAGAASAMPRQAQRQAEAAAPAHLSAYGQRMAAMAWPLPAPASPPKGAVDFVYGALAATDFPTLAWRRAYSAALLRRQPRLSYGAPEGEAALRTALQGYLYRARGLACAAEQILIVHGSQQALDLCARVLVDPGDHAVVEEPCYPAVRHVLQAAGARLLPVPVDEHGLRTDALPVRARTRLAFVTPSHQFPLGGVMPIARRHALLQWAVRRRAYVIEDDYDGEFRYGQRPIDALQSLDGAGTVIYVGTFSKALSPQLRLGYMVLPPALVDVFRRAKRVTDRHAPTLDQQALAALIESGAYERHIRRMRREHERRRDRLLQAIAQHLPPWAGAVVEGAAAGLHLILWLRGLPARHEAALIARARALGVVAYPVAPLYTAAVGQGGCAGLVLGYASLTLVQIERGVRLLAAALGESGPPARARAG